MNRIRQNGKALPTIIAAIGCMSLVLLLPQWRDELRAVDYPLPICTGFSFCDGGANCGRSCQVKGEELTLSCPACPDPEPGLPVPLLPPPEPPPRPVPPPRPEPPPPSPSPDESLSTTHGVPLNADRNGLFFADRLFQGPRGAELRDIVSAAAARFGVDPGLLAINMAAEVRAGREAVFETFTRTGPVETPEIGLDYWHSYRSQVRRLVPQARDIPSTRLKEHYINIEKDPNGIDTGPKHEFPNGRTALHAMAARLRFGEIIVSQKVGRDAWNKLSTGTQLAIIRAYYNVPKAGKEMALGAAKGRNVLVTRGPVTSIDPKTKRLVVHPRRAATIRAAQALHLFRVIFQTPVR